MVLVALHIVPDGVVAGVGAGGHGLGKGVQRGHGGAVGADGIHQVAAGDAAALHQIVGLAVIDQGLLRGGVGGIGVGAGDLHRQLRRVRAGVVAVGVHLVVHGVGLGVGALGDIRAVVLAVQRVQQGAAGGLAAFDQLLGLAGIGQVALRRGSLGDHGGSRGDLHGQLDVALVGIVAGHVEVVRQEFVIAHVADFGGAFALPGPAVGQRHVGEGIAVGGGQAGGRGSGSLVHRDGERAAGLVVVRRSGLVVDGVVPGIGKVELRNIAVFVRFRQLVSEDHRLFVDRRVFGNNSRILFIAVVDQFFILLLLHFGDRQVRGVDGIFLGSGERFIGDAGFIGARILRRGLKRCAILLGVVDGDYGSILEFAVGHLRGLQRRNMLFAVIGRVRGVDGQSDLVVLEAAIGIRAGAFKGSVVISHLLPCHVVGMRPDLDGLDVPNGAFFDLLLPVLHVIQARQQMIHVRAGGEHHTLAEGQVDVSFILARADSAGVFVGVGDDDTAIDSDLAGSAASAAANARGSRIVVAADQVLHLTAIDGDRAASAVSAAADARGIFCTLAHDVTAMDSECAAGLAVITADARASCF